MAASSVGELLNMNTDHPDVIFVVEGEEIPGHRAILSAVCPHFEKLLYGHFKESNSKEVEIKETSPKVFKELMCFVYEGQLNVSDWTIEDLVALLALAHRYEYQQLFDKAVQLLKNRPWDLDSWTLLNDVATLYDSNALKEKCTSFAKSKIYEFLRKIDLDKYTGQLICSMFESPNVSNCDQDEILSALFEWKAGQTSAEIMSVFQKIRWEKVSPDITAILIKELFSNLKNADHCQFWTKSASLFGERKVEEASDGVVRVDSVVLRKGKEVLLLLPKNNGFLSFSASNVGLYSCDYVEICFKNDNSRVDFPISKMEFESPTKFNIKEIYGYRSGERHTYPVVSEPTSNNGFFKYTATFSDTKQVNSLNIFSRDFDCMSQIILRNIVIY